MRHLSIFLIISSLSLISGCDDFAIDPGFSPPYPTDSSPTNDFIKLEFHGRIWSSQSNWKFSRSELAYIKDFNKLNYPKAEKIVFAATIRSDSHENTCYAELFNLTDSVPISNSSVQSKAHDWVEFRSSNIIDNLPEKNITLTFRVRSERDGMLVSAGASNYVYIFESK